jgi:hypothetical protein
MEFGHLTRLWRVEAKGLTHTSPGQRPTNGLGTSNEFSLKANGLSHIQFDERYVWD